MVRSQGIRVPVLPPLTVSEHWSEQMPTGLRGDSKEVRGSGNVDSEAAHLPFLLTPGLGSPPWTETPAWLPSQD